MNDLFPILAVETSGVNCSVALLFDDNNFVEIIISKSIYTLKN